VEGTAADYYKIRRPNEVQDTERTARRDSGDRYRRVHSCAVAQSAGEVVSASDMESLPNAWLVQLKSAPAADGTSLATLQAEKKAFRAAAAQAGAKFTERYAFDTSVQRPVDHRVAQRHQQDQVAHGRRGRVAGGGDRGTAAGVGRVRPNSRPR